MTRNNNEIRIKEKCKLLNFFYHKIRKEKINQ